MAAPASRSPSPAASTGVRPLSLPVFVALAAAGAGAAGAAVGGQHALLVSTAAAVMAAVAAVLALCQQRLRRLFYVMTLFDEAKITENFRSAAEGRSGFAYRTARASSRPAAFATSPQGCAQPLPAGFRQGGFDIDTESWLGHHCVTGLVVLRVRSHTVAELVHERYFRGNTAASRCISWSTGKSVLSALVGIAIGEGKIGDIEKETVTDYVPELAGTGKRDHIHP